MASPEERRAALDQAFDYRGDVTIHTTDGRAIQGYIFDRRSDGPDSCVRLLPTDGGGKVTIAYADIDRLVFTGRDTAAGKSWETWINKFIEKKLKGETAELTPESLD